MFNLRRCLIKFSHISYTKTMLPLAAKNDNFVVLVIVFGLSENNVVAGTTDKSKEKFMYFLQFTYFIAL